MKLIVGLGNPGAKYSNTKHNIGFITLDEIAYREKCLFNKTQCEAELLQVHWAGEKVLLAKPQTFMNESGRSVRQLVEYYGIEIEDLLVIFDDLDLPTGTVRLREKGGPGGHNGIKSIIAHLGTKDFKRIRIGIDRPRAGKTVVSHVLSPFPKEVHEEMLIATKKAADAAIFWGEGHSFADTMNHFNGSN